jgi:hypothetical protein
LADRQLTDLPVSTGGQNTDLYHTRQGPTDKSLSGTLLKDFVKWSNQDFYTISAIDNYTAVVATETIGVTSYFDGMTINGIFGTSTGPSTIDVSGIGVKNIKTPAGTDVSAGEINGREILIFDAANDWFELATLPVAELPFNIPSRNAVMNQNPVSQGQSTRTGMSSTIYTGNGSTQSITTGVDMSTGSLGGFIWAKSRDTTQFHDLFDTVRGATNALSSNDTGIETLRGTDLTSFDAAGFSVGSGGRVNTNTEKYVAWSFQTNQKFTGTTNRNKAYTAHYNSDMGFSIVGYEGDGVVGHEIPHHLGVPPELSIWKNRIDVSAWIIQGADIGDQAAGDRLLFDTGAVVNSATVKSIPSPTTISLDTSQSFNDAGDDIISYHFASKPGISKVGKYIGTGATGNNVFCGFRAGFVIFKNLTTAAEWVIVDNIRGDAFLFANVADAEVASDQLDFTDTGFVLKPTGTATNELNSEYLFLAFAETGTTGTTTFADYSFATTQDVLTIEQNSLISFAEGFNANGQVDTQEQVGSGVTVTLGAGFEDKKLYLFKDKAGSFATTEFRPLEGVTRDDADKWGEGSESDSILRTTAEHFDYESATGVALASAEESTFEVWKAFNKDDNNLSTSKWRVATTTTSTIQYKQDEKRILKSWRIRASDDADTIPRRFDVEGSDDGFAWTVIDSTYNASDFTDPGVGLWSALQSTSSNITAFLYHRLNITANHGDVTNTDITELEFNTILPSDHYLVEDGKMYAHLGPDLVPEGDFSQYPDGAFADGTGGWTVDANSTTTIASNEITIHRDAAGEADLQRNEALVADTEYQIEIDARGDSDSQIIVVFTGGTPSNITEFVTTQDIYTIGFNSNVATEITIICRPSTTIDEELIIKTLNLKSVAASDNSIERVYLAEVITNTDGEVTSFKNFPVAKTKGTDAEYQGNVKVHGEIENRGICTAWVSFDGIQNPPLIRDSFNVADVVSLGVGNYQLIFDVPMDNLAYSVSVTGTAAARPGSVVTGLDGATPNSLSSIKITNILDNANFDQVQAHVQVFGGKEIL